MYWMNRHLSSVVFTVWTPSEPFASPGTKVCRDLGADTIYFSISQQRWEGSRRELLDKPWRAPVHRAAELWGALMDEIWTSIFLSCSRLNKSPPEVRRHVCVFWLQGKWLWCSLTTVWSRRLARLLGLTPWGFLLRQVLQVMKQLVFRLCGLRFTWIKPHRRTSAVCIQGLISYYRTSSVDRTSGSKIPCFWTRGALLQQCETWRCRSEKET